MRLRHQRRRHKPKGLHDPSRLVLQPHRQEGHLRRRRTQRYRLPVHPGSVHRLDLHRVVLHPGERCVLRQGRRRCRTCGRKPRSSDHQEPPPDSSAGTVGHHRPLGNPPQDLARPWRAGLLSTFGTTRRLCRSYRRLNGPGGDRAVQARSSEDGRRISSHPYYLDFSTGNRDGFEGLEYAFMTIHW